MMTKGFSLPDKERVLFCLIFFSRAFPEHNQPSFYVVVFKRAVPLVFLNVMIPKSTFLIAFLDTFGFHVPNRFLSAKAKVTLQPDRMATRRLTFLSSCRWITKTIFLTLKTFFWVNQHSSFAFCQCLAEVSQWPIRLHLFCLSCSCTGRRREAPVGLLQHMTFWAGRLSLHRRKADIRHIGLAPSSSPPDRRLQQRSCLHAAPCSIMHRHNGMLPACRGCETSRYFQACIRRLQAAEKNL